MEKKEVNTKLKKTKEILKNKRYRALITLGFYFLFFAIVISMIRANNRNTPNQVITSLNKFNNYNVYKYTVNIGYFNDESISSFIYHGLNYYDDTKITVNDEIYYLDKTNAISTDNPLINLSLKLTPQSIYNLIKDNTMISKKELYNEGLIAKEYLINQEEFELFDITESLHITTFEDDYKISNIEINFGKEVEYEEYTYCNLIISINYEEDNSITKNNVIDVGDIND